MIELWCYLEDRKTCFQISISPARNISELQEQIYNESSSFLTGCNAQDLIVRKVDADFTEVEHLILDGTYRANTNIQPLLAWEKIGDVWPKQPSDDQLHVCVSVPFVATICPSSSNESNRSIAPDIPETWSPRRNTVRGIPGCGKTTLMNLLHAYILDQEPWAFVNSQLSWPPEGTGSSLAERLRKVDPAYPRHYGRAYLLFDEGQDSYWDKELWNSFFTMVCDGGIPSYRVVVFCSYGSPSSRPVPADIPEALTPLVLRDKALISLWPRSKGSIGILLNCSEYDDVVSRFPCKLNLHSDLQDLIYQWTVGHVGAVIEILNMISYQRVQPGEQFTVEDFHRENPTHVLVQKLSSGAFIHALPSSQVLSTRPDVVTLFGNLLNNGMIIKYGENNEAIHKCHRQGWIHANTEEKEDGYYIRYTFPSPLHAMYISWSLKATNEMPQFTSIFDLAINVISKFKPSQLYLPICCVGPRSTDGVPKVQYQDEFYRSVFSVTSGNICISPEFASARRAYVAGHIDFFIPVVKWGIKITQDGEHLTEHSSRFTSGAHGTWMKSGDMIDYILLDCRTSIPRKAYPGIPNLYHVVFQNEYQKVSVYNNKVELVKGPIALH